MIALLHCLAINLMQLFTPSERKTLATKYSKSENGRQEAGEFPGIPFLGSHYSQIHSLLLKRTNVTTGGPAGLAGLLS